MPEYRRFYRPGGTYFFTVVTNARAPIFVHPVARALLADALRTTQSLDPFDIFAFVLLPDHLHTLWSLPPADDDFSGRWKRVKSLFTHHYLHAGLPEQSVSSSRSNRNNRGVWQRRFWEHLIRDQDDLNQHLDYLHYNPVKHGHATCPHAYPFSTFHRFVRQGHYPIDWHCQCPKPPTPSNL